jgi:hypothetical protein
MQSIPQTQRTIDQENAHDTNSPDLIAYGVRHGVKYAPTPGVDLFNEDDLQTPLMRRCQIKCAHLGRDEDNVDILAVVYKGQIVGHFGYHHHMYWFDCPIDTVNTLEAAAMMVALESLHRDV